MRTHTTHYQRANGDAEEIEIEVEFTLSGGHGGTAPSLSYPGDPPEAPEFELVGAWIVETGEKTELSQAEDEAVVKDVYDNLDRYDDGDDYDDYDRDYDR